MNYNKKFIFWNGLNEKKRNVKWKKMKGWKKNLVIYDYYYVYLLPMQIINSITVEQLFRMEMQTWKKIRVKWRGFPEKFPFFCGFCVSPEMTATFLKKKKTTPIESIVDCKFSIISIWIQTKKLHTFSLSVYFFL